MFAAAGGEPDRNYLFDIGKAGAAARPGYVKVTPETVYDRTRGYGWLVPPSAGFDTLYAKLPDTLFRDGLTASRELVFRVRLKPGSYFVSIMVGYPGSEPLRMKLSLNGRPLADSVVTPWYRLSYQTIRRKVRIAGDEATVRISPEGNGNVGIYALEFRPVTPPHVTAFSPGPETDTAEILRTIGGLEGKIQAGGNNLAAVNQLDMVRKYRQACDYYEMGGWSWATRRTGMNQIQRMYAVIDLLNQLVADPEDPLYGKALYLLAKTHFWLVKEDRMLLPDSREKAYFDQLASLYPGHELIRMYRGEQLETPFVSDLDPGNAPRWAVLQNEAMNRMQQVIHWWVKHRQAANGELGGKYGDDVEMLRWWLPAILGADDETARSGYTRLADGIWNSGALVRGYDKKVDDVEHSAELFRDSHTGMFLARYGDPVYLERAMISMQNFGSVWSAVNAHGHRHFKSYYFSATETWDGPPYGVDVPLNARALLPGLWLAWYNRTPRLTRELSEWASAWVEDARKQENGKPAGVIPPAVCFENERIGGYAPQWYDPELRYEYYQWDHLGHVAELYNHLSGMYGITRDSLFLQPVKQVAALMKEPGPGNPNPQPGTLEWTRQTLVRGGEDQPAGAHPFGNVFALTDRLTGNTSLTGQYGSPYNRYLLTGDTEKLLEGFERLLESLRYNFPLMTSEVRFTDRVYARGSELLTGMYTGHFGRGFEYPSLVATWKNTGPNVAVFVRRGDDTSACISLYNAGPAREVTMYTWMLAPGEYEITLGTDANDDTVPEKIQDRQTVKITERVGAVPFRLPGKQGVVVHVRRLRQGAALPYKLADVAVSAGGIRQNGAGKPEVYCSVHNIGNAPAKEITVRLLVDGKEEQRQEIALLEAPDDLVPRNLPVAFPLVSGRRNRQLTITVSGNFREITSLNNTVTIDTVPPTNQP
ncbi:hypothetical protein GCM10023091_03510 [Ravibacter arvi]|uniref:CARDB domain-containing protein n=1 Tax=Ravibacter arvi TaxID=2051041 RepID=A0ABP8LPE0_9BACT